jgi:hypothetical protein
MGDGQLHFEPQLLLEKEFSETERTVAFVLPDGSTKRITVEKDSLAFTVCQVPVIYKKSDSSKTEVHFANGAKETFDANTLNAGISSKIFNRTGEIDVIKVYINKSNLR